MPIPNLESWNLVRVYGTWRKHDGSLLPGAFTVTIPVRLTNPTEDVIIPAGTFYSGPLNTAAGAPSMDLLIPATDDPDILETGWLVTITVTFTGGATSETYVIEVPVDTPAPGINLRAIAFPTLTPQVDPFLRIGVPGGLALLNAQGDVIDANGDPVTAGGGGGDTTAVTQALNDHIAATTLVHGIPDTAPLSDLDALPDLTLQFENGLI